MSDTASAERELRALMGAVAAAPAPREPANEIEAALAACRRLYDASRSLDALPIARAALELAQAMEDPVMIRRCCTTAGAVAGDAGDYVAAIELHLQALRIAGREENRGEMSRIWNNIGVALTISGNVGMGVRAFLRSLALVEKERGRVYSRFTALCGLANCMHILARPEEGLAFALRGLDELAPEFEAHDPYAALLLRRNLVRLLVANGRAADARRHVDAMAQLLKPDSSPRVVVAVETARALVDQATGRDDIALTRLDHALVRARQVPAALQDTLICLIRAEEAAGNAARALLRLEELSEHVYRAGIHRVRQHIEAAGLREPDAASDEHLREQAKARLIAKLDRPSQPDSWKALQRLGVSAVMRMDESGWHGVRVGALTRALATAHGMNPLQALEVGLAAELHDIGMLSVPEGILAKKGPLNDAERGIVCRHADASSEALADASHTRLLIAREIAQFHHASWDGTGYPARVGGEFIPLAARMCAIADAYDAMLCGFGGTAPRSMGEALDELRRCAGRQFDPELVATFEDVILDESRDLGIDLAEGAGMDAFQELVVSLKEDKGFL